MDIVKVLKGKNCQPRMFCSAKSSIRIEGEICSSKSGQHALKWYGPKKKMQGNIYPGKLGKNWNHSWIFFLGQWLDGNSINLENKRRGMDLGRKNYFRFGHTIFEVSMEYQVAMDFNLKEEIWNKRFRFRNYQHTGNVEIMWTDEIIGGDCAE